MGVFVPGAAVEHSIVTVRAAAAPEARRGADVLRRFGARHLVHYRANTLVDQ